MKYREHIIGATHHASSISELTCPLCGKPYLRRINRRLIDRLFSVLIPVRRYRCEDFSCQWEGNIRAHSRPRHHAM